LIDLEIINDCRKGDLTRFPEMVDLLSPFAFSVALRMMGDEAEANDIVQEAMISVWKKIKGLKNPDGFKSWFYRIVFNKCLDGLRIKKRHPETVADDKTWELLTNRLFEDTDSVLDNQEMCSVIKNITNKLSPKQKAVFILSDIEDMPHNEIVEITGMSKVSVKSNLYYARRRISELIKNHI